MKFLVIGHVKHKELNGKYFGYAPYVREMNIWIQNFDKVEVIAPFVDEDISQIDMAYQHPQLILKRIPGLDFTSLKSAIASVFALPIIVLRIFGSCKNADHIHIRCPGNIGLLGSLVQVFFPNKIKTAKYAGNWDPKSPQPLSYRFQKWVLRNNSITKNIKVLVYGTWNSKSKNIVPFFTASFSERDKIKPVERDYSGILEFVFSGALVDGKRPLLAIQIIQELNNRGISSKLDVYGHGVLSQDLMDYVEANEISHFIKFHGNVDIESIKKRLKTSHFIILPSRSEGWPKAIVEGMFFGTIPIVTDISCIRELLDNGNRGIIIEPNLDDGTEEIITSVDSDNLYNMSQQAAQWSQKYTLEYFESQIKSILVPE